MKLKLLFIGLMFATVGYAQQAPFTISIKPLTKNFYVCTSYGTPDGATPFPANCVFAVTNTGIVLIDTPWGEPQTQQLIDSLQQRFNKKIITCIATHFHEDRTGGLEILSKNGTETYASALTYKLAKDRGEQVPDFTFASDTTFAVDSLEFETFYPGQGHSRDNIVVWFPKEKILVGGCFLKSMDTNAIGNIVDANVDQWPVSVRKLSERFKDAKYVIPGHEGWKGGVKQFAHTIKVVTQKKQ